MTWTDWQVAPFTTSVFFVLGVITLYWATVSWLKVWCHEHHVKITDHTIEAWYGMIYMVVFTFGMQMIVVGHSYNWQFMNFQLIAIIFCGYFLSLRIPYIWLFPLLVVFMAYNHSLLSWQSWGNAVTLVAFFWALNVSYAKFHQRRLAPLFYLAVVIPFGGVFWLWMQLKHHLAWTTVGQQWLYLIVFASLLYIYVVMLTHDSELKQRLERFASHDSLTQAANFAAYVDASKYWVTKSHHDAQPLAMMMFDIDHFKHINDTYEHLAGDQVLQTVVATVQAVLDANDPQVRLFRTGGEEFNLIFPGYQLDDTHGIVTQIFHAVNHVPIVTGSTEIKPSISVGVAELNADETKSRDFYRRVDQNLYYSKQHGRRQITSR